MVLLWRSKNISLANFLSYYTQLYLKHAEPLWCISDVYNQSSLDEKMILGVMSVAFMYILGLFCMTLAVSWMGYSFGKAFSFAAGAVSNSGLCFEGMCHFWAL